MQDVTKSLLLEYHAGRATPLQVKLIESWLQDPRNEPLFYQTLFDWESEHPQYLADLSTGLDRYRQAMDSPGMDSPGATIQPHPALGAGRRLFTNWLVAASVAGLLLLTGWLLRESILYRTDATGFGEIKRLQLPDGSRVTLNANSTLRYERFRFGQAEREVFLTGEAEFSVVHTQTHQRFVVRTARHVNVEVLGTEFVVLARDRATRVVLTKGKVKLRYAQPNQQPQEITMRPGEQATLNESAPPTAGPAKQPNLSGKLTIRQVAEPDVFSAWKDHRFVFDDTPLRDIGAMIRDNYGLDVRIEGDELAGRMVSGTFEAADATELLAVLSELLVIDVVRQRNHVILSERKLAKKKSN